MSIFLPPLTFDVPEEAVVIDQLDSVAKYGIVEIVGGSGEVLEDDYGTMVSVLTRVMLVWGSYYCLQASRR